MQSSWQQKQQTEHLINRLMAQQEKNKQGSNYRHADGVLVLDKPIGLSSNKALRRVQRLFGAAKAGHTGSLDPLASGLLPLCFGEATKLSRFLLEAHKTYRTKIRLGVSTDSGDAEGKVQEVRQTTGLSRAQIEAALKTFEGELQQIPPMHSALKHQGQPLYKLARKGIEIERKPRPIQVLHNKLRRFEEDWIELDIQCSKGTYIRGIARDLGEMLGCGGHVCSLRRLALGPYSEDDMVDLETLEAVSSRYGQDALAPYLKPISSMTPEWPEICLAPADAQKLLLGMPVISPSPHRPGWVRLSHKTEAAETLKFLGIGEILDDGKIIPRRLIANRCNQPLEH